MHLDIINRIIEAEREASLIADKAAAEKEHLAENILKEKDRIRDEYMKWAKERVAAVYEIERKNADAALFEIEKQKNEKLKDVEATLKTNRERYITELFRSIAGEM